MNTSIFEIDSQLVSDFARDGVVVVSKGLKAGEQVMVDGFQKLQMMPPGTPVKAVPWQAPGSAAASAANPPAAVSGAAPAASRLPGSRARRRTCRKHAGRAWA